jgi:hypothetical protein
VGKRIAHLYARDDGETTFADVEIPTDGAPDGSPVACFFVPVTHMTYAEYPDEASDVIPGLHPAPARQFVMSLQGGFRVTASDGGARELHAGDWVFFDDLGSRGHLTTGLPGPPRINLVVVVADDWTLPTS